MDNTPSDYRIELRDWGFPVPPVYTGYWKPEDWRRYILTSGTPPQTQWRIEAIGYTWTTRGERDAQGNFLYEVVI